LIHMSMVAKQLALPLTGETNQDTLTWAGEQLQQLIKILLTTSLTNTDIVNCLFIMNRENMKRFVKCSETID